jgi:hypothetical protein
VRGYGSPASHFQHLTTFNTQKGSDGGDIDERLGLFDTTHLLFASSLPARTPYPARSPFNLPLASRSFVNSLHLRVRATVDTMWFRERETELTNPRLGAELLKDAKGTLPLEVFARYVFERTKVDGMPPLPHAAPDTTVYSFHKHDEFVTEWSLDPVAPTAEFPIIPTFDFPVAPAAEFHIDPQEAVDEALPLVQQVMLYLTSRSPREALSSAISAYNLLCRGSKRGRGQPSTIRQMAVRAYVIRKFNTDPKKPDESSVPFHKLADILFVEDGKCPRTIRNEQRARICGLRKHQYNSPCVKALETAVNRLLSAMEHHGIPVKLQSI